MLGTIRKWWSKKLKEGKIREELIEQMSNYLSDFFTLNEDLIRKPGDDALDDNIMQYILWDLENPQKRCKVAYIIANIDLVPSCRIKRMIRKVEKKIKDYEYLEEGKKREIIESLSKVYNFHLKVDERIHELAEDGGRATIHDFVTPEIVKLVRESREGTDKIISMELYGIAKKTAKKYSFSRDIFSFYKEVSALWSGVIESEVVARLNELVPEAYNSLL